MTGEPTQEQCRQLVDREVCYCVSTLIHELTQHAENFAADTSETLYELCGGYRECTECDYDPECSECGGDGEVLIEVFEHWIVSPWLARKLKKHDEIVSDVLGLTVWGRQTTGQSILLDSVITDIWRDSHKAAAA